MAANDLTKGKISNHLVSLTIPMFLGISSMIVASMIETIYIGVLGADELAAYSFTFPLMMALSSVSMGVGTGAASVIARAQGAGDRERVKTLATHAMWLTLLMVVLLVGIGYEFHQSLFSVMGAEGNILVLVGEYMDIWILGLGLFTLPMVASTVLRSVGNAKVPGYIMTFTSGFQVILSPVLIFGLLGFPELGFVGSAWANIIAGLVRLAGMFYLLIGAERLIRFGRHMFDGLMGSTRTILYIGFPSMLNSLIGPVSMAVIIWMLAEHGPNVVAGFGIVSRIEMLVMMILMSLSSSVGPFVGQNWGAGLVDRVYGGLKVSYRFCLFWGLLAFLVLAPFGDDLVSLVNDEPGLVESASWYLVLVPLSFGLMGIMMVSGSLFVALGKPVPTTVLAVLRMAVIHIPLAMILNHYFGYIGIFAAALVSNVLVSIVALVWSRAMLAGEVRTLGRA